MPTPPSVLRNPALGYPEGCSCYNGVGFNEEGIRVDPDCRLHGRRARRKAERELNTH